MNSSSFNKKKWLKNHLNEILQLKKQGLTHLAIIQSLKKQQKMPFDLTESLLSRYLKEFSSDEKTTLKTKMALDHKIERQNERLERQNNEIQNLKRRLERVLERNQQITNESLELKERNRILENKFLSGEARLKDLRRYNGYNNVHWKIAELEQKNDEMFWSILHLERLSERLAKPHEEAHEKLQLLNQEKQQLHNSLDEKNHQLIASYHELKNALDHVAQQSEEIKQYQQTHTDLACQIQEQELIQEIHQSLSEKNDQLNSQIAELEEQLHVLKSTNAQLNERNSHFKQQLGKAKDILTQQQQDVLKHEISAKQLRFGLYVAILICGVLLVLVIFT